MSEQVDLTNDEALKFLERWRDQIEYISENATEGSDFHKQTTKQKQALNVAITNTREKIIGSTKTKQGILDYIDNMFKSYVKGERQKEFTGSDILKIKEKVKKLETRKTSKWIIFEDDGYIECEKCKNALTNEYVSLKELAEYNKFCNKCGAEMTEIEEFKIDFY